MFAGNLGHDRRSFAAGLKIIGDGLLFVESDDAGVGADKSLVEDAAGQLGEFVFFKGLQHPRADFGGLGNLVKSDFALLALAPQIFAEGRQAWSLALDGCERKILLW